MATDMETSVDQEVNGRSPSKIKSLTLNCKSKDIAGISENFLNLENLVITNAGLSSLSGLPNLPKLKTLDLGHNQLNGEELNKLAEKCPALERLILKANPIKDMSKLQSLSKLKNLKEVDLTNSEAAKVEDYQKKLSEILPQLKTGKTATKKSGDEGNGDAEAEGMSEEEDDNEDDDESGEENGGGKLGDLLKDIGEEEDEDDEEFSGSEATDEEDDEEDDDDDDEEEGEDDEPVKAASANKSSDRTPTKGIKRKAEEETE